MREDTSSERFTLLLKMIARWIAPSKDNSSFTSSHWLPPVLNSPSETSLSVTEIPSVIAFKTSLNYARRHNNQFFSLMYGSTPNILRLLKGTGSSCFRKKKMKTNKNQCSLNDGWQMEKGRNGRITHCTGYLDNTVYKIKIDSANAIWSQPRD